MRNFTRKITAAAVSAAMLFCPLLQAGAYTFTTPDWGALLNERTAMVKESDFELYTQGSPDSAPYYGAKLEPRGGAYIGMNAEASDGFVQMGSYLTYIQEMWQNYIYYPANEMIQNENVIATIAWTVTDPNVDYNAIRRTLDMLNGYNKPMLIRFAGEMDQFEIGNDPELYKQIFRNVANMIHEYPNFAVVWSPLDLGALDKPFQYYYPGDEYVDWVGVSLYTTKYFIGNRNVSEKDAMYFMTGDGGWATNRIKPFMKFLSQYNIQKPVMISEGGVAVSNSFGENLDWWAAPRLRNMLWSLVMKYPQIKLINYFNTVDAHGAEDYNISGFQYAVSIFNEASAEGPYIHGFGESPRYVFEKASAGKTIKADSEGVVPLYTLAYEYGVPDLAVNYSVDGQWYSSSNAIPYRTYLVLSNYADGEHDLTISGGGLSKSYKFYKTGNYMRFGAWPEVQDDIKVMLNGNAITFDQPPVIRDDRTLVPVRAIFEALGAEVRWDGDTQTVLSQKGATLVQLKIGSNIMTVNGREIALDVPAQIINDRTLVPVRAIAEAYGCKVDWDGATKTVIISG